MLHVFGAGTSQQQVHREVSSHNLHWFTMDGAPEYTGSMRGNCLQECLKVKPQALMSLNVRHVGEIPSETEVCFGVVFIKIKLLTDQRHTFALCSTRLILIQILIQVLILTNQTRSNGIRHIFQNLFSACFMVNKCTDTKHE